MTKITKLTPKQQAQLSVYREKWLQTGLATGPCDKKDVEAAADLAYTLCGKEPPKLKIWLDSPLQGAVCAEILSRLKGFGAQVGDQVWAQVGDQVWAQVGAQAVRYTHLTLPTIDPV